MQCKSKILNAVRKTSTTSMRRDENEWIVFDVLLFMTEFTISWQHRELNPKAKDLKMAKRNNNEFGRQKYLSFEITVNSFERISFLQLQVQWKILVVWMIIQSYFVNQIKVVVLTTLLTVAKIKTNTQREKIERIMIKSLIIPSENRLDSQILIKTKSFKFA